MTIIIEFDKRCRGVGKSKSSVMTRYWFGRIAIGFTALGLHEIVSRHYTWKK